MPQTVVIAPYVSFKSDGSSNYVTVGAIAEGGVTITPIREKIDIRQPVGVSLRLVDVRTTFKGRRFTVPVAQAGVIPWQALFDTLALTAGSNVTFNLGEGAGSLRGWLKIEGYDNPTGEIINFEAYVDGSITEGTKFSPKEASLFTLEFDELYNASNTGIHYLVS